ncbi:MAG: hypothetical protein M1812_000892 [Candelaria pacifica]|nr:MAG: hypothetical protein M1812_000892 [Candelaria pacifica]
MSLASGLSCPSFWSYELMKQWMSHDDETSRQAAIKVLLCGGTAGVITWASIFPLDVIKTRVQVQPLIKTQAAGLPREEAPLLRDPAQPAKSEAFKRLGAIEIARDAYRSDGLGVFFRGLGVCSARAFLVNAVQVRFSSPNLGAEIDCDSGQYTSG